MGLNGRPKSLAARHLARLGSRQTGRAMVGSELTMALSEHELRILRDLEDSLLDCDLRCAAIQRRMGNRRSRRWLTLLTLLCLCSPIFGCGLILLAAVSAHGGIGLALLGSAVLALPCACVSWLGNRRTVDLAELHEPAPGSGTVRG